MSREIKFRVWDIENKKFFEPTYEAYMARLKDISITLQGDILRRTLEMPAEHLPKGEEYILSQYTGLKDRNGKEIYESDILKISGRAIPQEVKFEEGCFGTNEFLLIELIRDKSRTIEVIGNIWEEQP